MSRDTDPSSHGKAVKEITGLSGDERSTSIWRRTGKYQPGRRGRGTFHLQKRACTKKGPVVEDAEKASVAGPQKGACGKSGEGTGGGVMD